MRHGWGLAIGGRIVELVLHFSCFLHEQSEKKMAGIPQEEDYNVWSKNDVIAVRS